MRLWKAYRIAQHRLPSSLFLLPLIWRQSLESLAETRHDNACCRIERPDCHAATRDLLSRGEIRLCDDHPVGRDDLLPDLLIAPDLNLRIDGRQRDDYERHVEL